MKHCARADSKTGVPRYMQRRVLTGGRAPVGLRILLIIKSSTTTLLGSGRGPPTVTTFKKTKVQAER